jgi:hypothetical protein
MNKTRLHGKHRTIPVAGKKITKPAKKIVVDLRGVQEPDPALSPFKPVRKPGAFRTRDKNKLRAEAGQLFRNEYKPQLHFVCGKCKETITELMVTEHLLKCQPQGVMCGICKKVFPPQDFLEHIKGCIAEKK